MELLTGAGNIDKLLYAYSFGADACYIGLEHFSLRAKADNFDITDAERVCSIKKQFPGRKLYCALNIIFHNDDLEHFVDKIDLFKAYPFDAFIVQDLGLLPILQKYFPATPLHLSTQSSCVNSKSALIYKSLGFSRIILGRETSLDEIRRIKDDTGMALEAFCHGAMCIAYSGRCLMSAYTTGRSAQAGQCTHTCRWDYDVIDYPAVQLREHERNELFPVLTSEGKTSGSQFTQILSSKDLCMIRHLDDMQRAGVDAIKIEGRMKSIYYTAITTQAYKMALDALSQKIDAEKAEPFILELEKTRHRAFSTGFYYNKNDANKATAGETTSPYSFCATVDFAIKASSEHNPSSGQDTAGGRTVGTINYADKSISQDGASLQYDGDKHSNGNNFVNNSNTLASNDDATLNYSNTFVKKSDISINNQDKSLGYQDNLMNNTSTVVNCYNTPVNNANTPVNNGDALLIEQHNNIRGQTNSLKLTDYSAGEQDKSLSKQDKSASNIDNLIGWQNKPKNDNITPMYYANFSVNKQNNFASRQNDPASKQAASIGEQNKPTYKQKESAGEKGKSLNEQSTSATRQATSLNEQNKSPSKANIITNKQTESVNNHNTLMSIKNLPAIKMNTSANKADCPASKQAASIDKQNKSANSQNSLSNKPSDCATKQNKTDNGDAKFVETSIQDSKPSLHNYHLTIYNTIMATDNLEVLSPATPPVALKAKEYSIIDLATGSTLQKIVGGYQCVLCTPLTIPKYSIIRKTLLT